MSVSLNQYHGEIGSFYNLLTSQITILPISLFNILVQIFLLQIKKKKLYCPFLWMRFNCLKASATSRRQFNCSIYLWNFLIHLF